MPRPKRSKIASAANPAPRAQAVIAAPKPVPVKKAVVDEIEDEGEGIITSVRRLPRTHQRRKSGEMRAAVNAKSTSDIRKGRGRGNEATEDPNTEDGREEDDSAREKEITPPSIEMSRRESIIPTIETSVHRRGGQPSAHGKALDANDVVSSIESDIATVPTTLPRMENTILGKPTFRGRARQRAPSILGKGAGAARARSSSMGLEMTGAGNSSAPGTAQSTRFGAAQGTFKKRERQPSILGSNRKKMMIEREVEQSDQGEEVDEDMEDFDDFNPDDESTPLNAQKTKSISASISSSAAVPVSTSSSRKRRKLSEIQVPRSPSLPSPLKQLVYGNSSPARSQLIENETTRQSKTPSQPEQDIYGVSSPVRHRPAESHAVRQSVEPAEQDIYDISPDVRRRLAELQNTRISNDGVSPQNRVELPFVRRSHSRSITPDIERPQSVRSNRNPEDLNETNAPPRSSSPVTPKLPTARPEDPLSETNAPPRSSSSPVTPKFPTARLPASQRQTAAPSRSRRVLSTQDSPISSPPSLTHSPNYKTAKKPVKKPAGKKTKPEVPLTTATLQNLLPKRRIRRIRQNKNESDTSSDGEAEVDVSGLQSDDDELSYLDAPARRARTRTPGLGKGRAKTPGSTTKTTSKKPVAKAKPATKTVGKSTVAKTAQKPKRTYGSANKENNEEADEQEDESLEPDQTETPKDEDSQESDSKELKRLKRKFEAVDEWEMEFEDVQINSDDKRMADAR